MATQDRPRDSRDGGDESSSRNTSSTAVPSRNPIPLSASQEAQVRDIFYARVRSKCVDEIRECALGRTFSVSFACRDTNRAMNQCMKVHATPAEQDAAREEWFAGRMERQRERERKARRKLEQEKFLREWWGLPEKDREVARLEMEKLKRAERIGGFASPGRRRIEEGDGDEQQRGSGGGGGR